METDPLADYSLAEMSRSSGVSPNVFSAMFKVTAGLPPQSYLKVCRIRMAKIWLAQGKMSIAAIADRLKFCSAQYFATVFKEITGMTPLAWRKNENPAGDGYALPANRTTKANLRKKDFP